MAFTVEIDNSDMKALHAASRMKNLVAKRGEYVRAQRAKSADTRSRMMSTSSTKPRRVGRAAARMQLARDVDELDLDHGRSSWLWGKPQKASNARLAGSKCETENGETTSTACSSGSEEASECSPRATTQGSKPMLDSCSTPVEAASIFDLADEACAMKAQYAASRHKHLVTKRSDYERAQRSKSANARPQRAFHKLSAKPRRVGRAAARTQLVRDVDELDLDHGRSARESWKPRATSTARLAGSKSETQDAACMAESEEVSGLGLTTAMEVPTPAPDECCTPVEEAASIDDLANDTCDLKALYAASRRRHLVAKRSEYVRAQRAKLAGTRPPVVQKLNPSPRRVGRAAARAQVARDILEVDLDSEHETEDGEPISGSAHMEGLQDVTEEDRQSAAGVATFATGNASALCEEAEVALDETEEWQVLQGSDLKASEVKEEWPRLVGEPEYADWCLLAC